jgi:hypothetical protein
MKTHEKRLAEWGLSLDMHTRERLKAARIYAKSSVKRVYQDLAKRYVIRGEESGGATPEIGRYVTFADVAGKPLPYVQLVESLGGNGRHAIIVAPVLLRIELLRVKTPVGTICQLLVTKHQLVQKRAATRPEWQSDVVFRGVDGVVEIDLPRKRRALIERVLPRFLSQAGEEREIPGWLQDGVAAATNGACCIGCSHAHYAVAQSPSSSTIPPTGRSTEELTSTFSETTHGERAVDGWKGLSTESHELVS